MKAHSSWILLLFLLPLVAAPAASSVWDSNEAFYTQTPREMLQRSDWLVPYFNGQPRLNKPPLSYWLVAGLYRIFGVSLASERGLLVALAVLSVGLVYGIALQLRDQTTALLAAGIFATNFRFLVLSRRLLIDSLMLSCVLAGTLCFLIWRKRRETLWLYLTAICFALGFLAKGPVAWIGLAVLVGFSGWEDRGAALRQGGWKGALLLLLLLAFSWHLALGWRDGWQSVIDFFWRENWGRFAHLEYGPSRGSFYYLGVILADFFPWSLLFFGTVAWKFWRWRNQTSEGASDLLLALWIGVWLLLFSLSYNKQEYYILPIYPAAAIWVADFALHCRKARWFALGGGAVAALLGTGLAVLATRLYGPSWLWLAPAALALAFAAFGSARRWTAAAICLSFLYGTLFQFFLPPLEAYRPIHSLAEQIRPELERNPGLRVGYVGLASPSLCFYLNRPILEIFDLDEAARELDSGEPTWLIILGSDWTALQEATEAELRIVQRRPRLILTVRTLIQALRTWGNPDQSSWIQPVYLIANS